MKATSRRALAAALLLPLLGCARGASPRLILGSTFTLEDSGVLDSLVVWFRAAHPEQRLQAVVAGSGEVLERGRRGDADVLLTHAPADEEAFLRSGYGTDRRPVMHNDFVVLGPATDPARVHEAGSAAEAFRRIRDTRAPFVSRGDDSGTHKKERQVWAALGTVPNWPGYVEAGAGMADALRLASQRGAYILGDRATWRYLRHTLALAIAYEGDPLLRNDYSVMLVKQARNPAGARVFFTWITGPDAKRHIRDYGRARFGSPLFIPEE